MRFPEPGPATTSRLPAAELAQRIPGSAIPAVWLTTSAPSLTFHLAAEDVGLILLDMQHGLVNFADVVAAVEHAHLRGKPVAVRIPVGELALGARVLDAGAGAVIVPMVRDAAEASAAAMALKFPPMGERSFGPIRAVDYFGGPPVEFLRAANAWSLTVVMIETLSALDSIEQILEVPGVNGVFAGPGDLSIAHTAHNEDGPAYPYDGIDDVLRVISEAAKRHGKSAWTVASSVGRARQLFAMGYDVVTLGSEVTLLQESLRAKLAEVHDDSSRA